MTNQPNQFHCPGQNEGCCHFYRKFSLSVHGLSAKAIERLPDGKYDCIALVSRAEHIPFLADFEEHCPYDYIMQLELGVIKPEELEQMAMNTTNLQLNQEPIGANLR